jgi:hypothetical protein
MSDPLISALLGDDPAALAEDVSLATPLTSPRITGRDAVVAALGTYAEVMGASWHGLRKTGATSVSEVHAMNAFTGRRPS